MWIPKAWHYGVATVVFLLWFVSAVVAPWFLNGFDWMAVQEVWERWQTLNAGMVALTAGVVAFAGSQFWEWRSSLRRQIAARAYMPFVLSELQTYTAQGFELLLELLDRTGPNDRVEPGPLRQSPPELPEGFKNSFQEIIEYGTPNIRQYVSVLLSEIQIMHSRLQALTSSLDRPDYGRRTLLVLRINMLDYIRYLGVISTRVDLLYAYARYEANDVDPEGMLLENLHNTLSVHNVDVTQIEGLAEMLPPAVERANRSRAASMDDFLNQ
ncbi:hypothetical protein [cf. Phormidesmis sp. LEGE 11477]|uniref:hypothetical protein n=1 Tax=cf. Phormidesmis sp. LEGE 11477 TaxID=1828680 RepID=UPI001D14FE31|nr:hypothetical protein [cf. Phormidesmis sp. LEGE 11477]